MTIFSCLLIAEKHGTCAYPVVEDEHEFFFTTLNVYFKYNVTVSVFHAMYSSSDIISLEDLYFHYCSNFMSFSFFLAIHSPFYACFHSMKLLMISNTEEVASTLFLINRRSCILSSYMSKRTDGCSIST